jgi:hypothetical protein
LRITAIISFCLFASMTTAAMAMSPADLKPPMTSDERDYYETIKSDPATAQSFLVTRDYVRKAQALVEGKITATDFPATKPSGYSLQYLLPEDSETVNNAMGIKLQALMLANPKLLGQ